MAKKNLMGLALAAVMALSLAACGDSSTDDSTADNGNTNDTETTTTAEGAAAEVKEDAGAAAPGENGGFTEIPIFEDETAGFMNVSAVYFQAVPMSNGNEDISKFDIHLEADISANENTVGFGVGDWVPYLTVDYKVVAEDGTEAASGTFMTMSASDGPHYGANIALAEMGTYTLEITIHSPEENGYLVHTDAETGPGGTFDDYFADGNLTVSGTWDYVPIS